MLPITSNSGQDRFSDAMPEQQSTRTVSRLSAGLSLFILLVVGGCQRPHAELFPIEGTVTRAGRPLKGAEILFLPDVQAGANGFRATGRTDVDGRYRLRTDAGEDGAAVGSYRVCIRDPRTAETPPRRRGSAQHRLAEKSTKDDETTRAAGSAAMPEKYSLFDKTPLRAEVRKDGSRTFDFDIP